MVIFVPIDYLDNCPTRITFHPAGCFFQIEVFVDCAAKGADYSFCVHWMLISALRI